VEALRTRQHVIIHGAWLFHRFFRMEKYFAYSPPPDGRRPGGRGARCGRQRTGRHRHPRRCGPAAARRVRSPVFADGSFESPSAPAGAFSTFTTGQSIGPWTVTAGSVDLIGPGFWAAADGDQSLDLDGTSAGTVAQTFATTPGTTYTVSYALAGNPAAGPALKTGKVLVDGQDAQDFSFDITGKTFADMGYVTQGFTFLATRPATTLAFASTTPGAWGTRPRQHPAAHHLLQAILQLTGGTAGTPSAKRTIDPRPPRSR
jgi:choice-of-anchor C domain-containing protein